MAEIVTPPSPPNPSTAQHDTAEGPIVIDLGRKRRKDIRKLRRGERGRLMNRVEDVLNQIRSEDIASGKLLPVIVVIRERSKKNKRVFF